MENTPSLPHAETIQRLIYDLVRYAGVCDRVCTEQLAITGSQGYTLLAIADGEAISMNDLSLKMKLSNSTMTRMVDQLVQKGLVNRLPDADDRRVVRLGLSGPGRQTQMELSQALQAFFSQVVQEIPEEERESVIHSLASLNQAILSTLRSCCGQELN